MKLILDFFRSIYHLELDTTQDGAGLNLIFGNVTESQMADSNGAGKTSIALGFFWTLFGDLFVKVPVKQIIYNKAKRGSAASGHLELDVPGKGALVVRRSMTKSKHTVTACLNGVDYAGDVDVVNAAIVSFLGVDAEKFRKFFMFTGEFMFASQTDAAMKSVLASMVPLDVTAGMTAANARATKADADLANQRTTQQNYKDAQLALIDQLDQDVAAETHWAASQGQVIANAQATYDAAAAAYKEAQDAIQGWVAIGVDRKPQLEQELQTHKRLVDSLRTQYTTVQQSITDLNNRLNTKFAPGICAECGQGLPAAQVAQQRERFENERQVAKADLGRLQIRLKDISVQGTEAKGEMDKAQTAFDMAANLDDTDLNAWKALLPQRVTAMDEANKALLIAQNATNPYTSNVQRGRAAVQDYANKLAELEQSLPNAERLSLFWSYMKALCSKTGLAQHALHQVLPSLSALASGYLSMVAGDEMGVAFKATTERGASKFHAVATRKDGGTTYNQISAGECRRIDAAAFVAINKLASMLLCNFPVVFVDELLDHSTDSAAKQAMLSMLHHYAHAEQKQVFVISNEKGIVNNRQYFNRALMVTKNTAGSTVENLV